MTKIIIGAIATIIGGIMTGWGSNMRRSFEYQLSKAWDSSDSDVITIDIVFYLGVLILVVGIALLLYGLIKKATGSAGGFNMGGTAQKPTSVGFVCSKCGAALPSGSVFCPRCGCNEKRVASAAASPNATFCGNCGEKAMPGEKFCHKCGKQF